MRSLYLLIALTALPAFAASREVVYHGDLAPLNITPTFDNGYLLVWEGNAAEHTDRRIAVYRPDGTLAYRAEIQPPEGDYLTLLNGAVDTDGVVAVTFRPGGFALLSASGKQIRTVATGTYLPTQVWFGPDHTIWLAGRGSPGSDYAIFRRYSRDGNELGSFVPQSMFGGLAPVEIIGGHAMRAASDRIVALLGPDQHAHPPRLKWVELDLAGNVIGQPGSHRFFFSWALTPNGTIYATEDGNTLVYLDRSANAWKPATLTRPDGALKGADESGLIYQLANSNTYQWVSLAP
jgi:hypothetical protein